MRKLKQEDGKRKQQYRSSLEKDSAGTNSVTQNIWGHGVIVFWIPDSLYLIYTLRIDRKYWNLSSFSITYGINNNFRKKTNIILLNYIKNYISSHIFIEMKWLVAFRKILKLIMHQLCVHLFNQLIASCSFVQSVDSFMFICSSSW